MTFVKTAKIPQPHFPKPPAIRSAPVKPKYRLKLKRSKQGMETPSFPGTATPGTVIAE